MTTEVVRERVQTDGGRRVDGADQRRGTDRRSGLDDLIAAGLQLVDSEGLSAAVAAIRVLESTSPDEESADTLMARGLAASISDVRHRLNRLGKSKDEAERKERAAFLGRFQLWTTHSQERLADVLEKVTLEGVGGRTKRLIDFGMADVKAFRSTADSQVAGWQRRVDVMSLYEAMLTKHRAETGRALPDAALKRIRKLAEEAWV